MMQLLKHKKRRKPEEANEGEDMEEISSLKTKREPVELTPKQEKNKGWNNVSLQHTCFCCWFNHWNVDGNKLIGNDYFKESEPVVAVYSLCVGRSSWNTLWCNLEYISSKQDTYR
mmetsp:Transcript_29593/g.36572  ORF Transcript_29593/g.36572 Transcript_29593/m.36572 type:complete len:115 (-) Transcript_29593:258-602(-)